MTQRTKMEKVPEIGIQDDPSLLKQPKAVWAVFFAGIIAFMGLGLVDPILPAIANQLNATQSEVSLLFTSYNAVMALAMLVTGIITSRIGIKRTLLAGTVIIAVFSALGGASSGVWEIIGMRGGWGLGNALFVATALTAIVTLSKSGNGKAVILYEAAVGLGISVGPLLGGWLGAMSWRGPFFGVAVLMVIAFIFLFTVMPKTAGQSANASKKTSLADPFRALKHRSLLVFGMSAALYNFGFFTLLAYAPFVLGLDEHGLGFVFLGWGILLAFTSVFMAPKLEQRVGTVKSMCWMLVLFGVLLAIMGIFTSTQWLLIACVIVAGALLGNNNTLITTAVMNATDVERSTASAAYSFLRFIGGAIAPFLAGKLAEIFNPHVPFIVGAVFVFLAASVIVWNKRHIRHVDIAERAA
ncbi:MFS transporter [Virgibacillus sp. 179-BFC.A HS]|uniref:MFS transporter n=1 Tax=Tigheibacillus jepli TaxID=3035914 RepID=A0ABU5CFK0_9BACI|nr:MFS transporter [Virgibacillus sp. 179-BFC.A HS]MDY0404348.1 MFS transporter [Virgibacillus sp. 179-BFC.A HS]